MEVDAVSDKEKVRIASEFLSHAPPGEFNEVFNDVRLLVGNESLVREGCAQAVAQYNKEQFTPVRLDGEQKPSSRSTQALVTPHNELGGGRFHDPKSSRSFRFDQLRREASDVQPADPSAAAAERWRSSLQQAADAYMENHYEDTGTCAVFGRVEPAANVPALTLCIEAHRFQPKNFWNGRWRSQWASVLTEGTAELKGIIKVHVHYYEDGNVQLVSTKDVARTINVGSEPDAVAKEIIRIVEEEESAYQIAVNENYTTMSETTFKALRRQLPVTRTKVDWHKIQNYRVGHELGKAP